MHLRRLFTLFLTALVPWSASLAQGRGSAAPRALDVEEPNLTLEREVYVGDVLEQRFVFHNPSKRPIRIVELVDIGGSAQLHLPAPVVEAGQQGELRVRQPANRLGAFAYRYAMLTDEPGKPRYRMTLSGFAQSAYDPERPVLDFGFVDERRGAARSLDLGSREVPRLELEGAEGLPPILSLGEPTRLGVAGERMELGISLLAGTERGTVGGAFRLRTNVPHQPEIEVQYRAHIFGDVVPSEHPVNVGLIQAGQPLEKALELRSRDGVDFLVESVAPATPDDRLEVDARPCATPEKGPSENEEPHGASRCWTLTLRANSPETATVEGQLLVTTSHDPKPVPLRYVARFVSPGTVIKRLGSAAEGQR
ncbi:MAG: hypothetical protein AAGN66_01900 [Acidobacteriota bacterium]